MSGNAEITIKVKIINLCKPDIKYEKFIATITGTISNIKIYEVIFVKPVTSIITEVLLATCSNNDIDIVFIIGDVKSTERCYANEAIEAVIRKPPSLKLANLITTMEKRLEEITHYKSRCGISNKILFINLSGTHEDKEECFAAISKSLSNTIYLIRESENKHFSSPDIAYFIDSISPEQGENKNVDFEEPPSPNMSLIDDIDRLYDCQNDDKWFPMVPLESAMIIMTELARLNKNQKNFESVKICDAIGRISSSYVFSKFNVPPFRTSTKHGYAVLAKDGEGLRKVQKNEDIYPLPRLEHGTCVWVNSGAPIPEGATAVVQVKDTVLVRKSAIDGNNKYIMIMTKPQHGQNIKNIGFDVPRDKIIFNKFTRIGSEEIGLLAAAGRKEIMVIKQLSIGVLSIGDNLQEPGEPLKPGFVYDINRITLISLLKHVGYSSLDLGIVNDEESSIREKIKKALEDVDILVTTGSVNDKDLLKNILTKYFEAHIYFGNVNIKPGKSTTLASCKINNKMKYFWCLSGNPTSAFITAHIFLLPFLNKLHGDMSEIAIVSVQVNEPYVLHHRHRLTLTRLRWFENENFARAINVFNLFKDRLCNFIGSNALLILPAKKEQVKLLSNTSNMPALLVNYPRNVDLPLQTYLNF